MDLGNITILQVRPYNKLREMCVYIVVMWRKKGTRCVCVYVCVWIQLLRGGKKEQGVWGVASISLCVCYLTVVLGE